MNNSMHFDIFTVRQWKGLYTLQAGIARPSNAPHYKFTKADFRRMNAANAKNLELLQREFATLEDVMEEIKRLQFPTESSKERATELAARTFMEKEQESE